MHRSLPLAIAAVLLVGCQTDTSRQDVAGPGLERVQPVSIVEQVLGDDPALVHTGAQLIRSEDELAGLDASALRRLDIDFQRHDLILVTAGQMPTGGTWIHIDSIDRVGDVLNVNGRVNRPGPDEAATQAITHPFAAAIIEKTRAEVIARPFIDEVRGEPHPAEANDD